MRRHLLLALVLSLAAASCGRGLDDALAGTTTSTAPDAATTTSTVPVVDLVTTTTEPVEVQAPLVIWVEPPYAAAVEAIAADFTAALSIDVTVVPLALEEIRNTVVAAAPSGAPDLFAGKHTWLPELLTAGVIAPLGLQPRLGEFVPVAVEAFTSAGEVYGIPYGMGTTVLFRNNSFAGTPPTGFAEIKTQCEELGDQIEHCTLVPNDDPASAFTFLSAFGAYLVGRDDTGAYDPTDIGVAGPAADEGIAFVRDMVADGVIQGASRVTIVSEMNSGSTLYALGDELTAVALGSGAIDSSLLPLMGGATAVPLVDVDGFYLNATGANLDAAGVFVREYLATGPAMRSLFEAGILAPTYGSVATEISTVPSAAASLLGSAERGVPIPAVVGIEASIEALGPALAALVGSGGEAPPPDAGNGAGTGDDEGEGDPTEDEPPPDDSGDAAASPADLLALAAETIRSLVGG